jgi:hypothetical protein
LGGRQLPDLHLALQSSRRFVVNAAGRYTLEFARPIPRKAAFNLNAPRLFDLGFLIQAGEQALRQPGSLASRKRKRSGLKFTLS